MGSKCGPGVGCGTNVAEARDLCDVNCGSGISSCWKGTGPYIGYTAKASEV